MSKGLKDAAWTAVWLSTPRRTRRLPKRTMPETTPTHRIRCAVSAHPGPVDFKPANGFRLTTPVHSDGGGSFVKVDWTGQGGLLGVASTLLVLNGQTPIASLRCPDKAQDWLTAGFQLQFKNDGSPFISITKDNDATFAFNVEGGVESIDLVNAIGWRVTESGGVYTVDAVTTATATEGNDSTVLRTVARWQFKIEENK